MKSEQEIEDIVKGLPISKVREIIQDSLEAELELKKNHQKIRR